VLAISQGLVLGPDQDPSREEDEAELSERKGYKRLHSWSMDNLDPTLLISRRSIGLRASVCVLQQTDEVTPVHQVLCKN